MHKKHIESSGAMKVYPGFLYLCADLIILISHAHHHPRDSILVLSPLVSASSESQVHTPVFTQLMRTRDAKNGVYTTDLNKTAGMHKTSVSSSWISNISNN